MLDASIIIDALRAKDMQLLVKMSDAIGAVCGVTRAEILSGARGSNDRSRLLTILDGFQQIDIPDVIWDAVGDLQAQLRAGGITVPLADAALAAVALAIDAEVWARDMDFDNIQRVVPALKLFREGQ